MKFELINNVIIGTEVFSKKNEEKTIIDVNADLVTENKLIERGYLKEIENTDTTEIIKKDTKK